MSWSSTDPILASMHRCSVPETPALAGLTDRALEWACPECRATWTWRPEDETPDMVNHPPHYTSHPSGVECIQITEHMGFNLGSALKYIWRADLKGASIEDLRKAVWYVEREIALRERAS